MQQTFLFRLAFILDHCLSSNNRIADFELFAWCFSKFGGEPAESHELCCTDVRVMCGPGVHTSGSSKVKLRNIVDFNWDLKTYPGQLIAVHIRSNFFAYGLKS